MGLTIDTSVIIDFFTKKDIDRFKRSKEVLKVIKNGVPVYCPKLILAEVLGVLTRYSIKLADIGYRFVFNNFNLMNEEDIFEEILRVCKNTGSRAIDGYFIATAKSTRSILITSDKVMAENAKKYGIETYYLIEEFDTVVKRLKEVEP